MTTIVYRDGVLAADDKAWSQGWIMPGTVRKILKTEDGRLLGGLGPLTNCARYIAWLKDVARDEAKRPIIDNDSCIIEVRGYEIIVIHDSGGIGEIEALPYKAFGSGRPVALGALYMGASAFDAVLAAIAHDDSTNGGVESISLNPTQGP